MPRQQTCGGANILSIGKAWSQYKIVFAKANKNFWEHKMLKILLLLLTALLSKSDAILQAGSQELRVIEICLERFGGLTTENAERLQRYKYWSDTYEEIPCFTNCYLNHMLDIYNESTGFIQENVIKQFGQSFYDACRNRLEKRNRDSCELAYSGLHCIVNLENDPFILIENMQSVDSSAKTAMKDCLRKFEQYEWPRLSEYSRFPVLEPIPCFTKCFIDELQLFNEHTRRWNTHKMRSKLGFPLVTANINGCLANRRRNRNSCSWMYKEFTCFTLAK